MTLPCQCQKPGRCSRYERTMNLREWQICSDNCPPEIPCNSPHDSESYRRFWDDVKNQNIKHSPGLIHKIVNFTSAVVNHAINGFQNVPEDVYQQRLTLCQSNQCGYYKENRCTHQKCGCRLAGDLIAKLRWSSEKCPVGKWESWQPETSQIS